MTTTAPVYDRAPSPELQALVSPGGFLSPLIGLAGRKVGGHYHDVHFRTKDETHVYRGLTRLVTVKKTSNDEIRLTAHPTYRGQPCAQDFLRSWHVCDPGFSEILDHYLSEVRVSSRHLCNEGKVQEQWAKVNVPWIPFDREARLNYESTDHRERATKSPAVEAACESIQAEANGSRWRELKPRARKVDQLAIDSEGRLVLLELKDASKKTSEVYCSPFQLLQYVWEWHAALEEVRADIQALIDARVAVGLTSSNIPRLTGGIRAAVGFGPDERSGNMKRLYRIVLDDSQSSSSSRRGLHRDVGASGR